MSLSTAGKVKSNSMSFKYRYFYIKWTKFNDYYLIFLLNKNVG